jgi:5-methylcytosine-specific restriction endonuclease McrA
MAASTRKISRKLRLAIYARDGERCVYCGCSAEQAPLSLDHILPYHAGGGDEASNLVTACVPCNASKGTRPLDIFVCLLPISFRTGEKLLAHIAFLAASPLEGIHHDH